MRKGALIYVRVSTLEQAIEGISIRSQISTAEAYAQMRRLKVFEVIQDAGISGSVPLGKRPGGARLVELVKEEKIKAVISVKLDRLFRDAADCLTVTKSWDQVQTTLHLVDLGGQAVNTSTAMGRFFLTVMAGVAEMERGLMVERTKAALDKLKAEGKRVGSLPFGYEIGPDGATLIRDQVEQKIVRRACWLKARGMTYYSIAKHLDVKHGMRSRTGKRFQAVQIQRMVERELASRKKK